MNFKKFANYFDSSETTTNKNPKGKKKSDLMRSFPDQWGRRP